MRRTIIAAVIFLGACDQGQQATLSASVAQLKVPAHISEERRSVDSNGAARYTAVWEFAGGKTYQLDATGDERRPHSVSMSATLPTSDPRDLIDTSRIMVDFCRSATGQRTDAEWAAWIGSGFSDSKRSGKPSRLDLDKSFLQVEHLTSTPPCLLVTVTAK